MATRRHIVKLLVFILSVCFLADHGNQGSGLRPDEGSKESDGEGREAAVNFIQEFSETGNKKAIKILSENDLVINATKYLDDYEILKQLFTAKMNHYPNDAKAKLKLTAIYSKLVNQATTNSLFKEAMSTILLPATREID